MQGRRPEKDPPIRIPAGRAIDYCVDGKAETDAIDSRQSTGPAGRYRVDQGGRHEKLHRFYYRSHAIDSFCSGRQLLPLCGREKTSKKNIISIVNFTNM